MDKDKSLLNIEANFHDSIKPELDRRVQLVASSVIGSFLSGDDPRTISFRHVINRVMVLTQMPMCFVLFKKESGILIEGVTFSHSSRNKAEVRKCIDAVSKDDSERDLFRLFGLDFYLLIISVGKQKGDYLFETLHPLPEIQSGEEYIPKTARELAAYQLKRIFEVNQYASYGAYFKEKLLQPCLDDAWNFSNQDKEVDPTKLVKISNESTIEDSITVSERKDILEELEENLNTRLMSNKDVDVAVGLVGNGYFDRIFKKIHKNLNEVSAMGDDLLPAGSLPANYVIFLRDYAKGHEYRRHFGLCNYRLRIALCDHQKEEFVTRLKNLYDTYQTKTEKERFQYSATLDQRYAPEGLAELAEDLDREFWRRLCETTEEGTNFSEFVKIMEGYFGDQSRSIADAVFDDGILFFRRPFADGGIGRCFESTAIGSNAGYPKTFAEVENNPTKWRGIGTDLIRLVIGYYWYQGMVHHGGDHDDYELGIMLSPVEVGNRIWCVVGYFTNLYRVKVDSKTGRELGVLNLQANTTAWNKNFHIFQEVNVRVKRELRHSLANCYKDMAAWFYSQIADSGTWADLAPIFRTP
jgi:hypothetical protein